MAGFRRWRHLVRPAEEYGALLAWLRERPDAHPTPASFATFVRMRAETLVAFGARFFAARRTLAEIDPHAWLDPANARTWLAVIAAVLLAAGMWLFRRLEAAFQAVDHRQQVAHEALQRPATGFFVLAHQALAQVFHIRLHAQHRFFVPGEFLQGLGQLVFAVLPRFGGVRGGLWLDGACALPGFWLWTVLCASRERA